MNNTSAAYETYQSLDLLTDIEGASNHSLIDLLYKGIHDKLAKVRGHITHSNTAGKGQEIGKIIAILNELQYSLDLSTENDIAQNLNRLYTYLIELVTKININDDLELLEEASQLVSYMRETWNLIPADQRH